jgi:hypothetical protein
MSALPLPVRGGSVNQLRDLVYMPDDDMFVLYVLTLVGFFHPSGPYPALVFSGGKGSTKTTCSWIARELIDPNLASIRLPPREARDLAVAAGAAHVLTLENMDILSRWLSDMLAGILTGAGVGGRELFTDDDQILAQLCKPAIINGIDLVVTRPDLLERSVCLHLERLPDERRTELAELRARFHSIRAPNMSRKMESTSVSSRRMAARRLARSASALSRISAIRCCSGRGGTGTRNSSRSSLRRLLMLTPAARADTRCRYSRVRKKCAK